MSLVVRKFDFGQSFDLPDPVAVAAAAALAEAEPEIPPEPVFAQADLDAAERSGFMAGQLEGARLATERQEHRVALALADIAGVFPSLQAQLRDCLGEIQSQAASLVLVAAEKLFPSLIAGTARHEVKAMLDLAFERAIEEPRVTVRCAESARSDVDDLIKAAAERSGFVGKLTIIGDPHLAEGACRVEWSEGGLERDPAALLRMIETALRRGLETVGPIASPSSPDPVRDLESDPLNPTRVER